MFKIKEKRKNYFISKNIVERKRYFFKKNLSNTWIFHVIFAYNFCIQLLFILEYLLVYKEILTLISRKMQF